MSNLTQSSSWQASRVHHIHPAGADRQLGQLPRHRDRRRLAGIARALSAKDCVAGLHTFPGHLGRCRRRRVPGATARERAVYLTHQTQL